MSHRTKRLKIFRRDNLLPGFPFRLRASLQDFGHRPTDLHSGTRAHRRGLIETLGYDPAGAGLPVEILLRAVREGFRVSRSSSPVANGPVRAR